MHNQQLPSKNLCDMHTDGQNDVYLKIFIIALLVLAKACKQFKYPSVRNWSPQKVRYIHTVECYATVRKMRKIRICMGMERF